MALRKSRTFRAVAYTLAGLALLTGVAQIVQRALSGGWNESYRSAKLNPWTNGGAVIMFGFLVLVGLVGLFFYLQRRWRKREHV